MTVGDLPFSARVVVVTGAGRGIGAACARRFAAAGAAVVVVDRDAEQADRVVNEVQSSDGKAAPVIADVSRRDDWQAIIDAAHKHGPVHTVISNATIHADAPVHQLEDSTFDQQVGVALKGAIHGVASTIEDLRATAGSVVLLSSVHALVGMPGRPSYAAVKGGLLSLGRQLAVEYGPEVRVNTVLPGPIETPAWEGATSEQRTKAAQATALGRLGSADEVAAAVVFLASADAAFITGAALTVDGGWSICKDSA